MVGQGRAGIEEDECVHVDNRSLMHSKERGFGLGYKKDQALDWFYNSNSSTGFEMVMEAV